MKKLISSLFVIIVMLTASLHATPAAAQVSEQDVLTFADLGLEEDILLRGPYDESAIRFALPPTWALQSGAEIEVEVTSFSVGTGAKVENDLLGAILEVSFNGKLLQSIPLSLGEKILYRVPIDVDSLKSSDQNGEHKLAFFLDAALDCDVDFHDTTVMIDVDSKIRFPHELAVLSLDLKRLPWPIFLERGKIIDPVTVVLPASPSAEELQAGYVVMGAFGRMTKGKMPVTTVTADQLTEDILVQSHLLVVGKPSAFPMFSDLQLPVPLANGLFAAPELTADDGVVQIVNSPWNSSRVVLLVSGNTDLAVVKASQALSTSNMQTGNMPNYSVIAQVNPFPSTGLEGAAAVSPGADDIKLSDIGYTFVEASGIGTNWISYEFMIPAGQMPTGDVYLDLNVSTSSLVDPERSEGVVYMNDVQIGSVTLTSDTSNIVTSRINIPLSVVKSGLNVLDVVFNLLPRDECSLFTFADIWVTIYPDSTLHLPLGPAAAVVTPLTLQDLKAYPSPFSSDPSLSTTTFVVAQQDKNAWLQAGKIAFDLGTRVSNPVLGFRVVFDGQMPDELKTNHLILVGEPKNLSILSELKDAMPAYYESGSNTAVLESQQVIYRISAEKSLGYLQLFSSPWNEQAAVLGIFGTTPKGLEYAVTSMLEADARSALAGNFATLEESHAMVVDTRTGQGIGRIAPSLGPAVAQEDVPIPTSAPVVAGTAYDASKQMVFAGIVLVLALIGVTLLIVIVLKLRKKKA